MKTNKGSSHSMLLPGAVALVAVGAAVWPQHRAAAEDMKMVPPPAVEMPAERTHTATAVLAGGCFWGVQGVFQHVQGRAGGGVRLYRGRGQDGVVPRRQHRARPGMRKA